MKKLKLLLFVVVMMFVSAGFAQYNTPPAGATFTFKFSGVMPLGDLAKTTPIALPDARLHGNAGNASFGAGLGFEVGYRFDFGLGLVFSGDLLWNPLNADLRKQYKELSKTQPFYTNVPIQLGLDYRCLFGKVFGLYAKASAGVNLLYLTPEGWEDNLVNYDLSYGFACEVGGGIMLSRHLTLGVHYYFLGKQLVDEYKGTPLAPTRELTPSMLVFRIGVGL